jgi:hypothetical protein
MLPDWLVPGGHYSLSARQQAAQLASEAERTVEECIPDSADGDRFADPPVKRVVSCGQCITLSNAGLPIAYLAQLQHQAQGFVHCFLAAKGL